MTTHNKSQIQKLLENTAYIDHAIRLLGANQTADELRNKSTHHNNDIGFSAAYGTTGTRMYEFVTGINTKTGNPTWPPKSLNHPAAAKVFSRYLVNHNLETADQLGRKVAEIHWKQLGALLTWTPVNTPAAPKKTKKQQPMVTVSGAEIQSVKGKAVKVLWDSKRVWLPKSQINVNSENGDITMPKWLARNKGMTAKQGDPTVGGEKSSDGFDWDSWSGGS